MIITDTRKENNRRQWRTKLEKIKANYEECTT